MRRTIPAMGDTKKPRILVWFFCVVLMSQDIVSKAIWSALKEAPPSCSLNSDSEFEEVSCSALYSKIV
ncbi:hypothetical protein E4K67_15175 [Desulfosporosinus fructosivorans]|uniref:Uncharacterized protein n=1 Tax=Desulfosporosinus fructosivorans TaxID=2018669 RepID=A0A4Z0R418_9FIRM|nr:hypothetical protein [Desulfosporosinus fructosivorans]TGE37209.1 hypothetical protein E4K67_15175 [Desulfosporosinus fructosivorans]